MFRISARVQKGSEEMQKLFSAHRLDVSTIAGVYRVVNVKMGIDVKSREPYSVGMEKKPKPKRLDIYPDKALLQRLETWRRQQPIIPTRTLATRVLLTKALDAEGVPDMEAADAKA